MVKRNLISIKEGQNLLGFGCFKVVHVFCEFLPKKYFNCTLNAWIGGGKIGAWGLDYIKNTQILCSVATYLDIGQGDPPENPFFL